MNETSPPDSADDLEIIEQLLALALEAISRKTPDVRLGDVLKLLEFKHRVKPEVDAREIFWEWIGRFRREALEREHDRDAKCSPRRKIQSKPSAKPSRDVVPDGERKIREKKSEDG